MIHLVEIQPPSLYKTLNRSIMRSFIVKWEQQNLINFIPERYVSWSGSLFYVQLYTFFQMFLGIFPPPPNLHYTIGRICCRNFEQLNVIDHYIIEPANFKTMVNIEFIVIVKLKALKVVNVYWMHKNCYSVKNKKLYMILGDQDGCRYIVNYIILF